MVKTETATGTIAMAMMCIAISRRCHCRGVPCQYQRQDAADPLT